VIAVQSNSLSKQCWVRRERTDFILVVAQIEIGIQASLDSQPAVSQQVLEI
jgi:hypothetical protein